jgi:transposase
VPARRLHPDRVRAGRGGRRAQHRFTGGSIGSFVGVVPSEHSSGASRSQGPITKTGNIGFIDRRKQHSVAIARELAGWCWSLAVLEV